MRILILIVTMAFFASEVQSMLMGIGQNKLKLIVENQTGHVLEVPKFFMQAGNVDGATSDLMSIEHGGTATIYATSKRSRAINGFFRYRVAEQPTAVIIAFDIPTMWQWHGNKYDVKAERVEEPDSPDLANIARLHYVDGGAARLWSTSVGRYDPRRVLNKWDTINLGHGLWAKAKMTRGHSSELHVIIHMPLP